MTPPAPAMSRQITARGKKTSDLTMLVNYESKIYKAGKEDDKFTFRGDQQRAYFQSPNELLALMLTLHSEITKYPVMSYAIFDNRPEAAPYPKNIIIHKLKGVIMHDNTALYPVRVFELLNKFNAI
jgi:hypothetical protein